jgi:hypothetical protein
LSFDLFLGQTLFLLYPGLLLGFDTGSLLLYPLPLFLCFLEGGERRVELLLLATSSGSGGFGRRGSSDGLCFGLGGLCSFGLCRAGGFLLRSLEALSVPIA